MGLVTRILDLIYPVRCVGCGAGGSRLCTRCLAVLPRLSPDECGLCGHWRSPGQGCPGCRAERGALRGVSAACRYAGTVREAVHRLKYRGSLDLAAPLAALLQQNLDGLPSFQGVVPVPLHWIRERQRGYNQSFLLAREVSTYLGVPLLNGLHRTLATPAQVGLNAPRRRANVARAFTWQGEPLAGSRVLLIDDVTTTGATLRENAGALAEAGASWIWAAVVGAAR